MVRKTISREQSYASPIACLRNAKNESAVRAFTVLDLAPNLLSLNYTTETMGEYSFGIKTAHDLYCKLKREYAAFQGRTTDSDLAWNCAVTAYHLKEWLWKERLSVTPGEDLKLFGQSFTSQQDYNANLNRRCPNYKLLRDVCNGSKHFALDNPGRVKATTVRPGAMFGSVMFGEAAFGEGPYFAIRLDDGSLVRFLGLLSEVVALWDDVFKSEPLRADCASTDVVV